MNTKAVIKHTLVNEIMRLAGLMATKRVRRFAVEAGLAGPGINNETLEGVEHNVYKATNELRDYAYGLAGITGNNDTTAALLHKQEIMRLAGVWNEAEKAFSARLKSVGILPGPSEAQVAGAADRAKQELCDYAHVLAGIVPENDPTAALLRKQEIIADIGFEVGYAWATTSDEICSQLIDDLEGSRGLMQKVIEWANEFDLFWEGLADNDPRRENYIPEICQFSIDKFTKMVAGAGERDRDGSNVPTPKGKNVKLRVLLDIEYNASDVPVETLKHMAHVAVRREMGTGGFTGSTEATVENWNCKIV